MFETTIAAAISFIALIYWFSLPKPIPGIPHDPATVKRPFGDLFEFIAHKKQHGEVRRWYPTKIRKLNSPIVQVSIKPFAKPIVLISDFRESHDILFSRHKEYERTDRTLYAFRHTIPEQMVSLKTRDPSLRESRELMRDAMTTSFLRQNSVPLMYTKAQLLVELLAEKAHIAKDRPLNIREDLDVAVLDGIMAISFGFTEERSELRKQLRALRSSRDKIDQKRKDANEPVEFEHIPLFEENQATLTLAKSVKFDEVVPLIQSWWRYRKPQMKHAARIRQEFTRREISSSLERLKASEGRFKESALEYVLQRDATKARKEGREPDPYRTKIFDEILGYVFAGHDTTSASLASCMKHARNAQSAQSKLRSLMRTQYYATAASEQRQPTSSEIVDTDAPYLDAFIEEVLRLSAPLQPITRLAMQDTVILGHRIPKGTVICNLTNGPGFVQDTAIVPREHDRSANSQANREKFFTPNPDKPALLDQFIPERWIKEDENGRTVYDKDAAPMLAFGGGVRACFGKRLAYLQLRVFLVLLLWEFEMGEPDDEDVRECFIEEDIVVGPARVYVCLKRVGGKEMGRE